MSKPFFVYMLRCADGSYYVGHTDELERRVAQHQAGEIPGYTHERRPVTLVWSQETATREEALGAERRIKGWGRAKKEALMGGDWGRVSALARSRGGLRQAQPERVGEVALPVVRTPPSVRPELVEGSRAPEPGLRQAQPERGEGAAPGKEGAAPGKAPSVRPELVEGPSASAPGLRQAQRERVGEATPTSVRPELVEGPGASAEGLQQAQPERGRTPDHPELVEGPGAWAQGLRQAQPERGRTPDHPELVEGPEPVASPDIAPILASNRRAIAKAITLLESTRADHRARADELLNALLPHTGQGMRLGISGVPGVGKSTFIEALGLALIAKGHRVAVLAIDPSSSLSGGSILGDKTRMEQLSINDAAYIRPSPASGTLGGVAEKTREAMLVCEAAGFDVVIVETVGVGQSETTVASMTDLFVLLQLPNAGDDLQAIKKGVMEIADLVVINKADLDAAAATRAQAQITGSLRLFARHESTPRVLLMSALKGDGLDAFWQAVEAFHTQRRASGEFAARRRSQSLAWMWDIVHARLHADFRQHAAVRAALPATITDVTEARIAPSVAARSLLNLFER